MSRRSRRQAGPKSPTVGFATPSVANALPQPYAMPIVTAPNSQTLNGIVTEQTPVLLVEQERYNLMMGAYDSIYIPSYRFAQYNPDQLISQQGYDVIENMLTMAACNAPYNIKRQAVLMNGWKVHSAITDVKDPNFVKADEYAKFVTWVLQNIISSTTRNKQSFRQVLLELLRATWDGFHVSELVWRKIKSGKYSGKVGLTYVASKPAKEIGFNLDPHTLEAIDIMPYTPLEGYSSLEPGRASVPTEKVLLYTYHPQHGLPYGVGDARACYKHWWILDSLIAFWSMAMERWGSPVLVVKYPAGNTTAMQLAQQAVDNIRQGSAPIFPDNVSYELVNITADVLKAFKDCAEWHIGQIALNILGNSLTTSEGERFGSGALGKVHQGTQQYGIGAVQKDLEEVVNNQLIFRLMKYNYGEDQCDLAPRFCLEDVKPSDVLGLAQAFQLLVKIGNVPNRSSVIRDTMGLPSISPEEDKMLDGAIDALNDLLPNPNENLPKVPTRGDHKLKAGQ